MSALVFFSFFAFFSSAELCLFNYSLQDSLHAIKVNKKLDHMLVISLFFGNFFVNCKWTLINFQLWTTIQLSSLDSSLCIFFQSIPTIQNEWFQFPFSILFRFQHTFSSFSNKNQLVMIVVKESQISNISFRINQLKNNDFSSQFNRK